MLRICAEAYIHMQALSVFQEKRVNATEVRDQLLKQAVSLRRLVISYTYGIVNSFELAEDVYQECIVVICNKYESFTPGTNAQAWILEIARRTALGLVTKSYRKREHAISDEALAALANDDAAQDEAEQLLKHASQEKALQHCVEKLSPKAKAMIKQRYIDNTPCERIAELSKRSLNSIYVTLTRIRKSLKACIAKRLPESDFE